jgi:UDP-N-acetylglucosamine 2-epimerase (non-hydrolysing)
VEERIHDLTNAFDELQQKYKLPIIVSTHPHTRDRLNKNGFQDLNKDVRYLSPFGLFDFVALEKNARLVLSDSGTVQEECCIFRVPNVTIRDVTERPETIECGSNILSGSDPGSIMNCAEVVLSREPQWTIPKEYLVENASDTVVKIITGYLYNQ